VINTYPNWFLRGGALANFEKHLLKFSGQKISALQIGAYTGDATEWLMMSVLTNPESSLVDVDTWEGSDEPEHKDMNWSSVESVYDSRIAVYGNRVCKNKTTSDEFFETNDALYDFIYVDGDHTAASVLKDGVNAVKFIAPGGIIAFDDYLWRSGKGATYDPYPAINAIMLCFSDKFDVIEAGLQVWLKNKEQ
jgi:predicted O-methyltransferase YrrM